MATSLRSTSAGLGRRGWGGGGPYRFVVTLTTGEALAFARSLLADTGLDDAGRIDRAHARALGRRARPEEIAEALAYVAAWTESTAGQARPADARREEAWQSWCQALLCSNEFAYLD